MNRREFNKAIGAIATALATGATAFADDKKKEGKKAEQAKHVCKGFNECKGQGGCGTKEAGCQGKNDCKGKGGCAVPIKDTMRKKAEPAPAKK